MVGVTMGDPVGIGPEIVLLAFSNPSIHAVCRPLVIGDIQILSSAKKAVASKLTLSEVDAPRVGIHRQGTVDVVVRSRLDPRRSVPGKPTVETSRAMIGYITTAIDMALGRQIDAVITGPINKRAAKLSGFPFMGHTELLAERTGSEHVVMMMAGERLRVVFVTIHEPLRRVPDLLSVERISRTISLTAGSLAERFGIPTPRLAVAGLNPHAGEAGIMGGEEEHIISPAVEISKKDGLLVDGPFPPDTIFHQAAKGEYDAVVCMYHDQGSIPFKMLHFDDGVNTTLGLPIIRTSVDHGTAYDIAGTGTADPGSLVAAITMAARQASYQRLLRPRVKLPQQPDVG